MSQLMVLVSQKIIHMLVRNECWAEMFMICNFHGSLSNDFRFILSERVTTWHMSLHQTWGGKISTHHYRNTWIKIANTACNKGCPHQLSITPLILGGNIHTLAICTIKSQQSHLYLLLFHFNQPLCKPLKTLSSNRPHADSWASKGGKGSGGNPTTERRNDRLHYVFQISLKKCMKLS